jgi:hypothetical protein
MSEGYISILAQKEQRRRRGLELSHVAKMPPDEAKEELRQRVMSLIDRATKAYEEANQAPTAEEGLKLIRMWRELDAMGAGQEPRKHRKHGRDAQREPKPVQQGSDTVRRMVQEHHAANVGIRREPVAA